MIPGGVRWVYYKSRKAEVRLWWTGDWHVGNRGCAIDELKDDIAAIAADPYALWLGGGDYSDCVNYRDRRFDPEAISNDISVEELGHLGHALGERVRDLMKPIAGKCLGLLYGNHEDKYMQNTDAQQLHSWLCEELGVPNLGYSTVFDIRFTRRPRIKTPIRLAGCTPGHHPPRNGDKWSVRVFAHHGAGYAQTPGGKLNKLRSAMDFFPGADLTLLAHVHEQKVEPSVVLDCDQNCTRIVQHRRRGAISGTYLRTYVEGAAGYGEKKLYRPVPLGMTEIRFMPNKQDMRVAV